MEKTIDLIDVYKELKRIEQMMVTKAELSAAFETIAVMSNEGTMSQIIQSENDIKKGRTRKIDSVNDI